MILNLGTLFLMLIVIIVGFPCFICLTKPCKRCPCKKFTAWLTAKQDSLVKSLHGNVFIRYLLEGYLEILTCATINWLYIRGTENGWEWGSTFFVINNVTLILLSIAIVVLPIWTVAFFCKNFAKWQDEEFAEKYGAAVEGLDLRHRSILAYPFIFMVRRCALILVVVIWREHLFVQIEAMVIFSVLQVAYLTTYRPFEEPLGQQLDIFNEMTSVILVDLLVVFSEGNTGEFDFEADVMFMLCLFGNLSVHLFFLSRSSFFNLKLQCRRRRLCCWRKPKADVVTRRRARIQLKAVAKQAKSLSNLSVIAEEQDEEQEKQEEAQSRAIAVTIH